MAMTTSDFCSGSPPSLRSVEDDVGGGTLVLFDVEDDVGGGHACAFLCRGGHKGGAFVLEDDIRKKCRG